jgi:hypothetical protein
MVHFVIREPEGVRRTCRRGSCVARPIAYSDMGSFEPHPVLDVRLQLARPIPFVAIAIQRVEVTSRPSWVESQEKAQDRRWVPGKT